MSDLRVTSLRGRKSGTAPTLPDGAVITGIATATSFSGNVTGDVTGVISATSASLSGNVSVGGTLTYEDVTNIDSVGVITARDGIKIGAGQSVSAVSGIVTYYGDGSKLSGVESGVVNFVASGTIANGATVVINTNGTVSTITQTGSATPSAGTPVVFESANSSYTSAAYDSNSGKVVIAYRDYDNSEYGTAIVGTVSGTSISFGSPVTFPENVAVDNISTAFDSTNNKVVITYRDTVQGPGRLSAIVGTVSGTSISFGSAAAANANNSTNGSAVFDSTNGKIVIAYTDVTASNDGKAIVGTVSGTAISFGSAVTFNSGNTSHIAAVFDSTNGKVVISYRDHADSGKGKSIVGTVSGTSISFGSEVAFDPGTSISRMSSAFDTTNNKLVIVYNNSANIDEGKAVVGTVSGTSISFGTPAIFNNASTSFPGITFDSTENKVVIVYRDGGNSNYGTAIQGTVSGTGISFGSEVVFESAIVSWVRAAYDSHNEKTVIAYSDGGNSSYGTAAVFSSDSLVTNLTAENYIGIAAEAISNTATGKINILGGVNTGQTGLTTAQTYYVQTDGSLATSAGSPSVVAGTAISSTKVLVWKS